MHAGSCNHVIFLSQRLAGDLPAQGHEYTRTRGHMASVVNHLGNIELQKYDGSFFNDAKAYDMLVFTSTQSQSILMGSRSNSLATLYLGGDTGRVRTVGERFEMRFDGRTDDARGRSNGLSLSLWNNDDVVSPSGLLQFPDAGEDRASDRTAFMIGRGTSYSNRELTLTLPDAEVTSDEPTVVPSFQVRALGGADRGEPPMLVVRSAGQVGIGTQTPRARLEVCGDAWMGSGTVSPPGLGGPIFVQHPWTADMVVPFSSIGLDSSGEGGGSGMLFLNVKDGNTRVGHMQLSFARRYGDVDAQVDLYVVNMHRSDALQVFRVEVQGGTSLRVFADEGCVVCWTSIGSR